MPANWRDILALWLRGLPIAGAAAGQEDDTLQFVEGGLIYRLPWAMESVRVRGIANGDAIGDGLTLEDVELGLAVVAVETRDAQPVCGAVDPGRLYIAIGSDKGSS